MRRPNVFSRGNIITKYLNVIGYCFHNFVIIVYLHTSRPTSSKLQMNFVAGLIIAVIILAVLLLFSLIIIIVFASRLFARQNIRKNVEQANEVSAQQSGKDNGYQTLELCL